MLSFLANRQKEKNITFRYSYFNTDNLILNIILIMCMPTISVAFQKIPPVVFMVVLLAHAVTNSEVSQEC